VKNMRRNVQQGFTLIELMIVIAIVAILVALAVPAYQDYTIRSKVAECINNGAVPKIAIAEFRQTTGAYPADANQAGITADTGNTQFCDAISYDGDATQGTFTINVDEATIDTAITVPIEAVMTPTTSASVGEAGVDWVCSRGGTHADSFKYLPSTCRTS